jgi:hypothetical protein
VVDHTLAVRDMQLVAQSKEELVHKVIQAPTVDFTLIGLEVVAVPGVQHQVFVRLCKVVLVMFGPIPE